MTSPDDPWTIGRLLAWTIEYLGNHGAENPRLDAEVLLAAARGCKRIDLYAAYGDEASDDLRAVFRDFVSRRAKGTPVAYLVGHKEFYSLEFEVTPDVLIPRPETELVVVALLDRAKKIGTTGSELGAAADPDENGPAAASPQPPAPPLAIADVGTGSGILAVCAAKYLPQAQVTAIDLSSMALTVARRNAELHGVAERISFIVSDLLSSEPAKPQFDIVVSNPPYVSTSEMAELPADVREYEPHIALHGGEKGIETIERLINQTAPRLRPGGGLILEVSPMIADAVEQLVLDHSALELGQTMRDPAGHRRIVQATKP